MEMMLDKKQIQVIFLFECKMGHKTVETTHNINNVLGPGTANEHIVQWSLKWPLQRKQEPWRWEAEASHQKLIMIN